MTEERHIRQGTEYLGYVLNVEDILEPCVS